MKKRLFTGLVLWAFVGRLRKADLAEREAEKQLRMAILINDESIRHEQQALAILQESLGDIPA